MDLTEEQIKIKERLKDFVNEWRSNNGLEIVGGFE